MRRAALEEQKSASDAPTPLPQPAARRSSFPSATAFCQRDDEVGIIVGKIETLSAEVDHLMARHAKMRRQVFL